MPSSNIAVRERDGDYGLLVFKENDWGWEVTGTRERLIEAGLCAPAHFPEGRKRRKDGDGPPDWTVIYLGKGRWKLFIRRTNEQIEDFRAGAWARAQAASILDNMPNTDSEWRAQVEASIEQALQHVRHCLTESWPGFSLDAASLRAIEAQFARFRLIVANASIGLDEKVRENSVERLRQTASGGIPMPKLRAPLKLVTSHS